MCDVTQANFNDLLPEIISNINSSTLIAIDCEFTGLSYSKDTEGSLFDSIETRYSKLRNNVSQIITSQIGISTFKKIVHKNRYEACTYNFYISPHGFTIFDRRFLFQASCMNFLCHHKFDFNKFAYEGLPFLNQIQETEVREMVKSDNLIGVMNENFHTILAENVQRVFDWSNSADPDEEMLLDISSAISLSPLEHQFIKLELKKQFFDLEFSDINVYDFLIKKLHKRKDPEDLNYDSTLNLILGFNIIFRAMVDAKKPFIGHNLLTDLMLLYNQFYKPLPKNYHTFKKNLNSLFPEIYDTKNIFYKNRKVFNIPNLFLSELDEFLKTSLSNNFHSPVISHAENFNKYNEGKFIHEAGYDSFITGRVFIFLTFKLATAELNANQARPMTFSELRYSVNDSRNKLNMMRANIHYINLEGKDPVSVRPQWLYVELKSKSEISHPEMFVDMFSSYGSVDAMLHGPNCAIVAVGNKFYARDIMKAFKNHKSVHVTSYSIIRHSKILRRILWGASVFTSGISLYLLMLVLKRK